MNFDLDEFSYEPQWFDYKDGSRLEIRPYPAGMDSVKINVSDGILFSARNAQKKFVYCLTRWEKIDGADNKLLPCTDEVKIKIYDFHTVKKEFADMVLFVFQKAGEFGIRKLDAEKN